MMNDLEPLALILQESRRAICFPHGGEMGIAVCKGISFRNILPA